MRRRTAGTAGTSGGRTARGVSLPGGTAAEDKGGQGGSGGRGSCGGGAGQAKAEGRDHPGEPDDRAQRKLTDPDCQDHARYREAGTFSSPTTARRW